MSLIGTLSILLVSFAQQPAQRPAMYTVSGVLVEHLTNRPLANMAVGLALTDRPDDETAVRTDAAGRFAFSVPAGKYSLAAHGRDGTHQLYKQDEAFSTGIVAGPGQDSNHIVFAVKKPASIFGTVTNEEGEPVQGAQVFLFRKAVSFGKEQTTQFGGSNTGADGAFHQGQLAAGTYYLAASARPWYAQNASGLESAPAVDSELDVAYPITYYGDVQDARLATPIQLVEGAAARIQITVSAVKALHVPLPDIPAAGGQQNVQIVAEGPGGARLNSLGGGVTETFDGTTRHRAIVGIAPGRYMLEFFNISDGRAGTENMANVEINGNGPLNLAGNASTTLSGKVEFEEAAKPAGPAAVFLSCAQQSFPIGPDGAFSWSHFDLPPGKCQVQIAGLEGFYVSSVWLNGKRLPSDLIDIPAGTDVNVKIGVRRGGLSKVSGVVLKDGQPYAGAMVLVLPEDLSRTLAMGRDQSDSDGTFGIEGVRPGRYTVLGIDDGSDLIYQEPGVIKPYLAGGVVVTLPMQDDKPLQVPVQARR